MNIDNINKVNTIHTIQRLKSRDDIYFICKRQAKYNQARYAFLNMVNNSINLLTPTFIILAMLFNNNANYFLFILFVIVLVFITFDPRSKNVECLEMKRRYDLFQGEIVGTRIHNDENAEKLVLLKWNKKLHQLRSMEKESGYKVLMAIVHNETLKDLGREHNTLNNITQTQRLFKNIFKYNDFEDYEEFGLNNTDKTDVGVNNNTIIDEIKVFEPVDNKDKVEEDTKDNK